jgi:hypothetical protein
MNMTAVLAVAEEVTGSLAPAPVRVYASCVPHNFFTIFNVMQSAQGMTAARSLRIPTLPAASG